MSPVRGEKVRVTVSVGVSLEDAFACFTEEINLWWGTGPAFRVGAKGVGKLAMDCKLGGKITEQSTDGGLIHEVGTITVWDPPKRLVFDWRSVTFVEGESTVVEVLFEAVSDESTKVTVEHRGWRAIREDHPVRHGQAVPEFIRGLSMWWGSLASSFRERCVHIREK